MNRYAIYNSEDDTYLCSKSKYKSSLYWDDRDSQFIRILNEDYLRVLYDASFGTPNEPITTGKFIDNIVDIDNVYVIQYTIFETLDYYNLFKLKDYEDIRNL